jgi:F-type H+-transporting ATPase subunit epsilon
MTVLAPAAEFAWEIDMARAQRARERAEKQLAELNREEKDWEAAQAAMQVAQVRIQVASREARR